VKLELDRKWPNSLRLCPRTQPKFPYYCTHLPPVISTVKIQLIPRAAASVLCRWKLGTKLSLYIYAINLEIFITTGSLV
jgi:hypothetical protein